MKTGISSSGDGWTEKCGNDLLSCHPGEGRGPYMDASRLQRLSWVMPTRRSIAAIHSVFDAAVVWLLTHDEIR